MALVKKNTFAKFFLSPHYLTRFGSATEMYYVFLIAFKSSIAYIRVSYNTCCLPLPFTVTLLIMSEFSMRHVGRQAARLEVILLLYRPLCFCHINASSKH